MTDGMMMANMRRRVERVEEENSALRSDLDALRGAVIETWRALEVRPEPWACELYRTLSAVLLSRAGGTLEEGKA